MPRIIPGFFISSVDTKITKTNIPFVPWEEEIDDEVRIYTAELAAGAEITLSLSSYDSKTYLDVVLYGTVYGVIYIDENMNFIDTGIDSDVDVMHVELGEVDENTLKEYVERILDGRIASLRGKTITLRIPVLISPREPSDRKEEACGVAVRFSVSPTADSIDRILNIDTYGSNDAWSSVLQRYCYTSLEFDKSVNKAVKELPIPW